jgi:serine/threonine-protein kinase
MVTVKCTSTPPGAAIFNEENVQIGATPMDLTLSRDKKHTLTFRLSGYQDVERTFVLSNFASDSMPVDITLTAIARPNPPSSRKPPKQSGKDPDMSVFE